MLRFGPMAEELGFDSIWVMDHLLHAGFVAERLGDKPYYHPLTTLSYLSALTKRVELGTSILVLPYHNPIEMAKYFATLDQFSGGRVILGIGAGELEEEFHALGVPRHERGALTNEGLALMKEFWSSDEPRVRSKNWRICGMKFTPKPKRQPRLPVLIGGSSPGAMKRTAKLGDGWHPTATEVSPQQYQTARVSIESDALAAGRLPSDLTWTIRIEVAENGVTDVIGIDKQACAIDQLIEAVDAYKNVGVTHVVIALGFGDVRRITEMMQTISENLVGRKADV